MTSGNQFIKVGSAPNVIELAPQEGESNSYTTVSDSTWGEQGTQISIDKLRQQIEPWLTALFQSEHLNLLIGAGLSTSIQMSATGAPPAGMGWIEDLSTYKAEIDKFAEEAATKAY
ncbi:hypothetical protein PWW31_11930 [Vibrio harveyi]|nr:hypothetical protein PWW31_11930 [Vibrio harveyi]